MIAEIQCLATPPGRPDDYYAHIDAAIEVIAASGLRWEVGPLGTSFEGSPDQVWNTLRDAHNACLAAGADSVVTIIKMAEGAADGPDSGVAIEDLVRKFRQ